MRLRRSPLQAPVSRCIRGIAPSGRRTRAWFISAARLADRRAFAGLRWRRRNGFGPAQRALRRSFAGWKNARHAGTGPQFSSQADDGNSARSEARRIRTALAAAVHHYNNPTMAFSPDGKQILIAIAFEGRGEITYLAPWPQGQTRTVFRGGFPFSFTPQISWMPDSRRIVFADSTATTNSEIFMADVSNLPILAGVRARSWRFHSQRVARRFADRISIRTLAGRCDRGPLRRWTGPNAAGKFPYGANGRCFPGESAVGLCHRPARHAGSLAEQFGRRLGSTAIHSSGFSNERPTCGDVPDPGFLAGRQAHRG